MWSMSGRQLHRPTHRKRLPISPVSWVMLDHLAPGAACDFWVCSALSSFEKHCSVCSWCLLEVLAVCSTSSKSDGQSCCHPNSFIILSQPLAATSVFWGREMEIISRNRKRVILGSQLNLFPLGKRTASGYSQKLTKVASDLYWLLKCRMPFTNKRQNLMVSTPAGSTVLLCFGCIKPLNCPSSPHSCTQNFLID